MLVHDTTAPTWSVSPANQIVECDTSFNQQLAATDLSGISHWRINDTEHFLITSTGLLKNLGFILPGSYGVSVTVFDIYNNPSSRDAIITIQDTEDPVWNTAPTNQNVEFGADLQYELDAYDPTGIETWYVNDVSHFVIDENGTLSNIVPLGIGSYGIIIQATDPYGNSLQSAITIAVSDNTAPTLIEMPKDQVLLAGEAISYQLNTG